MIEAEEVWGAVSRRVLLKTLAGVTLASSLTPLKQRVWMDLALWQLQNPDSLAWSARHDDKLFLTLQQFSVEFITQLVTVASLNCSQESLNWLA